MNAFHHAEQLKLKKEIEDAVNASTARPLTKEEATLIAWASGVQVKEKDE